MELFGYFVDLVENMYYKEIWRVDVVIDCRSGVEIKLEDNDLNVLLLLLIGLISIKEFDLDFV